MSTRVLWSVLLIIVLSSCGNVAVTNNPVLEPSVTLASPIPSPTTGVTQTEVVRYVPTTLSTNQQSGSCWGPSIAAYRPGAYRCMVGNEIFDPCFAVDTHSEVVICQPNPVTGEPGIQLNLSEPLPSLEAIPEPGATAWMVELPNGTACTPFTGTRGQVNGQLVTYHCAGRYDQTQTVLLGDLTKGEPWTAQQAIISGWPEPQLQSTEVVVLRRVWQ